MVFTNKRTIILCLTLLIPTVFFSLISLTNISSTSTIILINAHLDRIKLKGNSVISGASNSSYDDDDDGKIINSNNEDDNKDNKNDEKTQPETKVNAAFITLARNSDLEGLVQSIESVESKFNHRYQYDWVFLNDDDFTDEFKQKMREKVSGTVKFAKIPQSMWAMPNNINKKKYEEAVENLAGKGVPYAKSQSYHSMCRFESGFFFNLDVLKPYQWYWRVEPEVEFFCDIDFDPFKYMQDNKKVYGTILIPYEVMETIPGLWPTVKDFVKEEGLNEELLGKDRTKDNALYLISENDGDSYNNCHFWSNFEIASLDFFRSERYTKFFNYLDAKGGFWYERWGDAPVHTMAAALFLERSEIHLFSQQFGYQHTTNVACPKDDAFRKEKNCGCDIEKDITFRTGFSCGKRYHDLQKIWYDSTWVSEW